MAWIGRGKREPLACYSPYRCGRGNFLPYAGSLQLHINGLSERGKGAEVSQGKQCKLRNTLPKLY